MVCCALYGQSENQIGIGFYNLENLFDVYDDSLTLDEEFTPSGAKELDHRKNIKTSWEN